MKLDNLRVRYFMHCLFHRSGYEHGKFLKAHNAFHSIGENFFFQPYNLPADAKYIRFGNNVVVASNVTFICHDVIHNMLNNRKNSRACGGDRPETHSLNLNVGSNSCDEIGLQRDVVDENKITTDINSEVENKVANKRVFGRPVGGTQHIGESLMLKIMCS